MDLWERRPTLVKTGRILSRAALPLAILATFVSQGCSRQKVSAENVPEVPTVEVAKARLQDLSQTMVLTAEFKPFQEIEVMAKVAGYVNSIPVDAGDRVRQGQLLAVLEIPEMTDDQARADAALQRGQAEVARARDDLQRSESAHQVLHVAYTRLAEVIHQRPGLVAQQEVDDAHGKDLVSEAQVAAAKSTLEAAEQQVRVNRAELSKVKTLSDYARVTAPFDGIVTKRYADTGSMIQAGTASNAMPLVKLSQNSQLRLILPVPESAVPTVHVGQAVEVRVPTLRRTFPGRVARFAERVASATRTMDTEVDVANPTLTLIPGMFAEVDLVVEQSKTSLAVPIPAVDVGSEEGSGQVVAVTADNKIEIRKVTLGLQSASDIQIKSGLSPGDLVVLGNRSTLRQGQQVRPKLAENDDRASR